MAREFVQTDTIGADLSIPGQVKFFIRNIPGSLPDLTGVADGWFLTAVGGQATWTNVAVAEDQLARDLVAEVANNLDTATTDISDLFDAVNLIVEEQGTQNTDITNLQSSYDDLRLVPSGGTAGQALIVAPNGVDLTFGNVASSGGTPGAAGSKIYSEAGVPANTLGADSDIYINETSTNLDYYQKVSGSWVLQGTLKGTKGDTGTAGTTFRFGSTVPASGLGVNGDTYYHTGTYDLYQKSGGAWSVVGNLRGAPGTAGAKGNTFASWSFNGNGDSYFQTPVAMTLQTPQIRNGATIVFAYSTDGTTFSTATFPLSMAANSIVRARATNVSGWASAAAAGS